MSSSSTDPTPQRPRPGGRTARVRAQVLDAVQLELTENGYDALTVDAVAARAGVHRTTVYRRWHDVGGLIADVFAAARDLNWNPSNTGSLRGDLAELNREIRDSFTDDSSIAMALVAVSFRSPEATRALQPLLEDRYKQCEIVVHRAIERGEIPTGTDAHALLIAATAPVYHRVVLLRSAPDPGISEQAAGAAVLAAQAGAFRDTAQPSTFG